MKNWKIIFTTIYVFLVACSSTNPDLNKSQKIRISEDPHPEALRYFMEGQELMNLGNYAMAIIEFQHALLYDSHVSSIHLSIADCYWMLSKSDLSFFHINSAIKLEPRNFEISELLAKRYISVKEIEKGEEIYYKLFKENPDSIKYIISLAEISRLKEDFKKSIDYYEKAYQVDPSESTFLEYAVELSLKLNDEYDTLRFRITLEDRDLNLSNEETTFMIIK